MCLCALVCVCCRLVEAFGSTRRKRQLQQRAEGAVVVTQNAGAAELDVLMQEVQARAQAAGDTREEVRAVLGPSGMSLGQSPREQCSWVSNTLSMAREGAPNACRAAVLCKHV